MCARTILYVGQLIFIIHVVLWQLYFTYVNFFYFVAVCIQIYVYDNLLFFVATYVITDYAFWWLFYFCDNL